MDKDGKWVERPGQATTVVAVILPKITAPKSSTLAEGFSPSVFEAGQGLSYPVRKKEHELLNCEAADTGVSGIERDVIELDFPEPMGLRACLVMPVTRENGLCQSFYF
ncbi:MAG: hypothetical protein LBU69_00920 [Deltaproteobacteria bacterium]|nr:hypothetical protein [Deltaproteobacteria bacterium]